MKRILVSCLVLLILVGVTFSVKAEDAGSVTLDFTQFIDQMKMVNQSERPSYGIETTTLVKSTEFTSMNIKIVEVGDGNESTCLESNITSLENITIDLDPGTYKVYTQLEGDDTVLEYNNDSEGYVITPQSHLVIPMAYPPWEGYILDAPWRIENSEIEIPILAVDTGTDWADIYDINVYDHNDGDRFVASTNWSSTQPIYWGDPFFHLFNINKSSFVQIDGKVSMRIKFELHWSPDNWEGPVNVKISQYDIPTMVDWYCGDTHQHTNYTDNAVELGAPIYATRAANNAMGLDWMIVTDHSFDLWQEKWNVSTADCNNHSDNLFRVLQGEEVSCYLPGTDIIPWQYQYNHLLVYGADFIPGGEWEDDTGSDYTPEEAIAIANSQGGVTYPAHPFTDDPFRDPWQNYSLNFTGLQIWNHASDEPSHLPDGLAKWNELLLGGRHVYVEGGTDAHGDFNTIAGKVKTYVYTETFTEDSILDALRNGHSVMTDGPLVIFDINGEMIGNNVSLANGTNATLRVQWNSTQEFGYIDYIIVKKGVINETNETNFTIIQPSSIGKDPLCDEHELTISPNKSCYYRVEAYSNTTTGEQYRCYTNPIWVDVVNDTNAP
ncbi:MAG: CehA/McbA family metallohydrolase [Euryarchaeota archaeon]|nr:CehA/McbA family metallohydrolase [Euryarchaeota archaeon]